VAGKRTRVPEVRFLEGSLGSPRPRATPATLFDLRPIRRALQQVPPGKLSASDSGLLYWAGAYDAIVCYREVTPADR
jgi:hypothetical protein